MILSLFLTFLEVGAVSFGGGYGMISLIRELCLQHGWLTEERLLDFIAVAESTPGPIAVNMATFVGSSQAGIPGALAATLGVVLPSFVIILIIAALARNLLKYPAVQGALQGIRPCVVGLILATGCTMLLSVLLGISHMGDLLMPDWKAIGIFCVLAGVNFLYKRLKHKKLSSILLIAISAGLGALLYSL